MTQLVRHGVFETNSSSAHSLSVAFGKEATDVLYDTIFPDADGVIHLHSHEFGWGYEEHYDAKTKAEYLLQYSMQIKSCAFCEDRFTTVLNIIREHTGVDEIIVHFELDDWESIDYGYIDHQAFDDDLLADLFRYNLVHEFIFNPNSRLVIDHDNH